MPNTLAHAGVQGLLTRSVISGADLKWIYLGVVIPDIPWILQRAVLFAAPATDPFLLRSYVIIQASLIGCLILAAAIALLARRFWLIFAILGGNVVLHLVFDAMQTKWANGAHFFAPFSWDLTNWGLFWPESYVTYALTVLGLIYIIWHWQPAIKGKLDLIWPDASRLPGTVALLTGYFVLPLLLLQAPIDADTHFVRTLSVDQERVGSYVEIDRARYLRTEDGTFLRYYGGAAEMRVEELRIDAPATVSIRGIFIDDNKIHATEYHIHAGGFRDYASYVGLALIIILWAVALLRRGLTYKQEVRTNKAL